MRLGLFPIPQKPDALEAKGKEQQRTGDVGGGFRDDRAESHVCHARGMTIAVAPTLRNR